MNVPVQMATERGHGKTAIYIAGCRCQECTDAIRAYRQERTRAARSGELVLIHGTISAYNTGGCRCAPCREIAAEKKRTIRTRLRSRPRDEVPHGRTTGYREWGCRCVECSRANTLDCCAWKRGAREHLRKKAAQYRRAERERAWRNLEFRRELLKRAEDAATGELAALISEQHQELRFADRAPSWMLSLDAPWPDEPGSDRYDGFGGSGPRHLIEWDDPTVEAALLRCEVVP